MTAVTRPSALRVLAAPRCLRRASLSIAGTLTAPLHSGNSWADVDKAEREAQCITGARSGLDFPLGVKEQRAAVVADLDDAPPSLGSGNRLESNIVTWSTKDAPWVPTSSLFRRDGAFAVFAIEGDKAALTAVDIGHRSKEHAEVLGGLAEGARVILFPSAELTHGARVTASP